MLAWNRVPKRLYLVESSALVTGVMALASYARFARPQLKGSADVAIVEMEDLAFFSA
jgi:hypothetical protein